MPSFTSLVPEDDNRPREVCDSCGYVAYDNPKIVVGSVVAESGRVLLCRRAIEPRRGFWTLPAGYLEHGETLVEGAAREALEEAGATIRADGVLALYSISRIGQVQIMFRARFDGAAAFAPGVESLDVRLFAWDEIPWDELAFPTVRWALQAWRDAGDAPLGAPAQNPSSDERGTNRLISEVAL
ncbi:MAG: NUDIX hydrolase [Acetobacteraceae bacterium]|nr:NUDIX hydrolase [Acetobacteraceae bacterium]